MTLSRKMFATTCALLTLLHYTFAQPCDVQLQGVVKNEKGDFLNGVAVLIVGEKAGTVTDSKGAFTIKNLCAQSYTVTLHYLGYETQTVQLSLPANALVDFVMKIETQKLDEVVVHDHTIDQHHSANTSVLSAALLAATAGKTLGESLKELPGVNSIQAGPGIFKPVIHGVHSQRVLILNHGIRQEGQQWGAEHGPEIDPFVASSVTVVKDASAIKYGTDAIGGVILVNPAPLPVDAKIGGSFNTIVQSNGRSGTVSGMLEGGIKRHKGWGWRLQGTAKRTGDFKTPGYILTNTGVRETNFSGAFGWHQERKGFEVFYSHFSTELGILKGVAIGNLDDLVAAMERLEPLYTTSFSYQVEEPRQTVTHNLFKVNGHSRVGGGDWRVQYGYQSNNRKEFDRRIGDLSRFPALSLRLQTHTLESEWETSVENSRTTCVGVNGMFQNNANVYGTRRLPFIPNFNNLSAGIFGISKFYLEKWTIDVGARYDYRYYNVKGFDGVNVPFAADLRFHNASATGGATYALRPDQSITSNVSFAWRPPHVSELYSQGTHQSAAAIEYGLLLGDAGQILDINSSSFENERAIKWVTTYRRSLKQFNLELTAYANYIRDFIYLRPSGITRNVRGTFPYFRYAQTDALFLGSDVAATYDITHDLRLSASATLLRASDERNDDYLIFIPPNRYDITLRYEKASWGKLVTPFVEARLRYTDRQRRAPRVISPRTFQEAIEDGTDPLSNDARIFDFMEAPDAYMLFNASAGFAIKSGIKRFDVRLASENIGNIRYRDYTNRFRYYADDLGRNFILSLKCIF